MMPKNLVSKYKLAEKEPLVFTLLLAIEKQFYLSAISCFKIQNAYMPKVTDHFAETFL